jgi:DNA-binding transcriptional LysR family regulator
MPGVNLKNLDLNLLVVFEAVYSAGNISHAADRLAMSQPAVSNALARLRDLLDDQLFVRAKRGVTPTTKAQAMIGPVREALGLIGVQLGGKEIDLNSYRRTFRISALDVLEPLIMPPLLNMITASAPGVSIEGVTSRPEIVQDVLDGTIDLACFIYPVTSPEISIVPIGPVNLVAIARPGHPMIGSKLEAAVMNELAYVALSVELRGFTQVDRELLVHGIKRRIVMSVSRLWSMPSIVAETDLIGMVPRAFARHVAGIFDLVIHDLPVALAEQHLYLMWNIKMDTDPGHSWLRELLIPIARQALAGSEPAPDANVVPDRREDRARQRR